MARATNSDIWAAVAAGAGISDQKARDCVEAVFGEILRRTAAGDEVVIRGFGKFALSVAPPHRGRDMGTGEAVMVGARNSLRFTMSRRLKDEWNREQDPEDKQGR